MIICVTPSVDNFEVSEFDKVGVLGISDRHYSMHLLYQLLPLLLLKVDVPLGQPGLPRSVLDHDELDPHV